jgi:hypothetical protein
MLYGASTKIGCITSQTITPAFTMSGGIVGGNIYSSFKGIAGCKVAGTVTTKDFATAWGVHGLTGAAITSVGSNTLKLYAVKLLDGGTRTGGSVHRTYTINKGIIFPTSTRASHQGALEHTMGIAMVYDGTNAPFVEADTAAAQTAVTDNIEFTLGGITIGAFATAQVKDVSIDWGVNVETFGEGSDIYDTMACVTTISPKFTIRGLTIDWVKSAGIPLTGKACLSANTKIYFRKRANGGAFVADETAEHLSVVIDGLCTVSEVAGFGSSNAPGECTLSIEASLPSGGSVPLTVNAATAIT